MATMLKRGSLAPTKTLVQPQKPTQSVLVELSACNYFLKGDVSGIQDFIFSVKSEGAAKTLKARSFYVKALTGAALKVLETEIGKDKIRPFFDGGGNFYAFCQCHDEDCFVRTQTRMDAALAHDDIHLALGWVPYRHAKDAKSFSEVWDGIQEATEIAKKKGFASAFSAFLPFVKPPEAAWKDLAEGLTKATGSVWLPSATQRTLIHVKGVEVAGQRMELLQNPNPKGNDIATYLPVWGRNPMLKQNYAAALDKVADGTSPDIFNTLIRDGGVIPFNFLSAFAWQRTGTDKLGILKMDIDNLGQTFREMGDLATLEALSKRLGHFYEQGIFGVLKTPFTGAGKGETFADHVYPVFSGGDDCFLIGGWDAIMSLAPLIQSAFEKAFERDRLSISAGLVLVGGKYPVVRFSHLADEALRMAKYKNTDKNKVALFGETLTWPEYKEAERKALELRNFVMTHQQPKTLLRRLQRAKTGFERLVAQAAEEQHISAKRVWRLSWFLRNSIKGEGKKNQAVVEFVRQLVSDCENALLDAAFGAEAPNALTPGVFVVAGRWAEFLTKDPQMSP